MKTPKPGPGSIFTRLPFRRPHSRQNRRIKRAFAIARASVLTVAACGILCSAGGNAWADLRITSLHTNGQLSWTYENSDTVYRVEWSPTVNGPWSLGWEELGFIPSLGSTSFSVSVPMFYRVTAQTNSGFNQSIFVSGISGMDVPSAGGLLNPCRTVQYAIQRAVASGSTRVNVAAGTYAEALTLPSGVSLFGGYNDAFNQRNPAGSPTIIQPVDAATATIVAANINTATVLDGFFIYAPATSTGPNTIAVYLLNCSTQFVATGNTIFGGSARDGADGAKGNDGANGSNGQNGAAPFQIVHNTPGSNPGGAGGSGICQSVNVSGGAGGSASNPVFGMAQSPGANGQSVLGGTGGIGGVDAQFTDMSGCVLLLPEGSQDGTNGGDGQAGANGSAGFGAATSGSLSGNNWLPSVAASGGAGQPGGGGGGGGAGGGSIGISTCNFTYDNRGPSGGGGGAGGCAGGGGGGGASGGSAFAVFICSQSAGLVPVFQSNTIYLGKGGNGGRGGQGGRAGTGGQRGQAQTHSIFGPGQAGQGGQGGDGGHGGGGGGGAGGLAVGIFANFSGGDYATANNIMTVTGAAGKPGTGGLSLGSPGATGVSGAVHAVLSD